MSKTIATGEPALTTSTITAVVAAAITLAVAFGFNLSTDQTVAITGFVAVLAPLVSGFFTRKQVTPAAEVAVQTNAAGDLVAGAALTSVKDGAPVVVHELGEAA